MSIDVLIQGRLRGAVAVKTASNGVTYAVFKLACTDKKNEGLLVSCITFSQSSVAVVQALQDGDTICVSGEAAISTWTGKDGTQRTGLDVTVHAAMTAYHAGRKRVEKPKATQTHQAQGQHEEGFYDRSDL